MQSTLSDLSLNRICTEIHVATGVTDVVDLSLAVGIVGTQSEWNSTVRVFDNVLVGGISDFGISAVTIQDSLVTLALTGTAGLFGRIDRPPYLEIDHMVSLHFLDNAVFNTVKGMFDAGTAWTLGQDPVSGYGAITLDPALLQLCNTAGRPNDMTCAVRTEIFARAVQQPGAVFPFATAGTQGASDIAAASAWLQVCSATPAALVLPGKCQNVSRGRTTCSGARGTPTPSP